jgi:hypothetical protein
MRAGSGQWAPMLIFFDPPEPDVPALKSRAGIRDYLALAAVILAILVSLAGVCLVVVEASSSPSQTGRVTIAAT